MRMSSEQAMTLALSLAKCAAQNKEVPVGCIILKDDKIVGCGFNQKEHQNCSTAHAEIIALQNAARTLGNWRLSGCTLISTLEPCIMCAGAIIHARIEEVFFGLNDQKFGAFGSLYNLHSDNRLNHQVKISSGILASEIKALMQKFFKELRNK